MLRRVLPVAVLIAVLAAVPASAAKREVPRGWLGMVADGPLMEGAAGTPEAEWDLLAQSGAESVRMAFRWPALQPEAGTAPNLAATDALVLAAARRGLRLLPVVEGTPTWAALHPSKGHASPPHKVSTYTRLLRILVRRYGPTGSLWAEHPEVPRLPIRDWQVWNEPSGGNGVDDPSVFWQKDGPWADDYVALLKAAHTAVRAADPSARILLGGLVGRSWEALALLYDAGAGPYFERVALHPYTGDPHDVDKILQYCRTEMAKHGDAKVPFVLTEFGWPSFNSDEYKRLGAKKIARYQAQWAQTAIAELTYERIKLRIASIFWFTWVSHDTSAGDAFDYAGLTRLTPGGKVVAKPSLKVFSRWALKARYRR
jgi:polysaccharide biosynthesis protein PslG